MIKLSVDEGCFVEALREERLRLDRPLEDGGFGHASWLYEQAYKAAVKEVKLRSAAKVTFVVALISCVLTVMLAWSGLPTTAVASMGMVFLTTASSTMGLALAASHTAESWHSHEKTIKS
jgi:hypothetical protein